MLRVVEPPTVQITEAEGLITGASGLGLTVIEVVTTAEQPAFGPAVLS